MYKSCCSSTIVSLAEHQRFSLENGIRLRQTQSIFAMIDYHYYLLFINRSRPFLMSFFYLLSDIFVCSFNSQKLFHVRYRKYTREFQGFFNLLTIFNCYISSFDNKVVREFLIFIPFLDFHSFRDVTLNVKSLLQNLQNHADEIPFVFWRATSLEMQKINQVLLKILCISNTHEDTSSSCQVEKTCSR